MIVSVFPDPAPLRGRSPLFPFSESDMTRRMLTCGVMILALAAGTRGDDAPAKAAPTAAAPTHPGLERIKKLAGTWVEADKDGKPTDKVVSVVKVTAGGSAV